MDESKVPFFWCLLSGVTDAQRRRLVEHFGQLPDPRSLELDALQKFGISPAPIGAALHSDRHPVWQKIGEVLDRLGQLGCQPIAIGDEAYPPLLAEIHDPPPLLFCRGDPSRLSLPQIAMVGSRQCSRSGIEDAKGFAAALGDAGFTLTSGLAAGIDAAVHRAVLEKPAGTVAVIGCGPDLVYPAENKSLYAEIIQNHCLVTEYPPGTEPLPAYFPRRNRIVSGLSLAVLVVEASQRSGSLITARLAMEQGREVFAMPGSIHDPRKRGCHRLIKQGAGLVASLEDLQEELQGLLGYQRELLPQQSGVEPVDDWSASAKKLHASLDYEPVDMDELVACCDMDVAQIQAALCELEIAGAVQRGVGGYSRCRG